MGVTQDPPKLDSTDLEIGSSMWLSSSDTSSQADDLEDTAADVEYYIQNRQNPGSVNPKQMLEASAGTKKGLWKCRACGWTYPNRHPTARQKLEHKKHCKGLMDDAILLDSDAVAGSNENLEKQVSTNAYEEVMAESGVSPAVAVSKSEPDVILALEDTNMDNLVSADGVHESDPGKTAGDGDEFGHLGFKGQNGLLVNKHYEDDRNDLGSSSPSSSSSSTSSSPSEAVESTALRVEEASLEHHEPLVDVSSPFKGNFTENGGSGVDLVNKHDDVGNEAGELTVLRGEEAIPEHHEPLVDASSPFKGNVADTGGSGVAVVNKHDDAGGVSVVLTVLEAIPEYHEPLVGVKPPFQGNTADNGWSAVHIVNKHDHDGNDLGSSSTSSSSSEGVVFKVLYAEEAISKQSTGAETIEEVQTAETKQNQGLEIGSPQLEAISYQAFHEESKALGLSESLTKDAYSAGGQGKPAHDLETVHNSGPEDAMREKPDKHHAPAGYDVFKEPHSYIVESPREPLGWTEASSSRDMEAYEVERVIRTQTTHDLICPYCRHNVTDRIILRKRKRTSRVSHETWVPEYDSSSTQEEESLQHDAQETAELDKDKAGFWGCLSCFTIFIPKRVETQPAETTRARAADVLEDSKASSTCLPLLFPPFKWKPAETIPPPTESVQENVAMSKAAPAADSDVEKASWLSCLPATLTSFEVPAPVARISTGRKKESAPETKERSEAVGRLVVEVPKPLATEDLEEEIPISKLEEPLSVSPPVPAAKGEELESVDDTQGVEIVEEHLPTEPKKVSTSEIVEVPDEGPARTPAIGFVADQEEKTSCLSFLPATLTSFDLPPRVETQYKYRFKQIQDENQGSVSFEGHRQKEKASCLCCLPATFTSWEFPPTPVLQAQTENVAGPNRGEKQEEKTVDSQADVSREERSSCLSCLPVTLTSWEFPQAPPQAPIVHFKGEEDGQDGSETETETRLSEPDRGRKTVHDTVIQGTITNTTTTEEPGEPPITRDRSIAYFHTSIKVEEAKRRFTRKKKLQYCDDEVPKELEEGAEWEDHVSELEELSVGSDQEVEEAQDVTSQGEGTVIQVDVPSMKTTLSVAPGLPDNDFCEPESIEVTSTEQLPTTTVSISQTYHPVQIHENVAENNLEDSHCNCFPAHKFSWFTHSSDYMKLEASNSAPTARPTPVKIGRGDDWAELQKPLLAAPLDADPDMTTVNIRTDLVAIQVQGSDANSTLQAAVTEAEHAGLLQHTNDGLEGIEILKSIVYGGLDSTLTSLAVVASAAGGEAKTITVVALGIANVLAGMIAFFTKVISLDRETFRSTIGRNLWLNGSVAILSFIIFGMAVPITFGFSFRELDDKDYKVYATCAVAVVSIVLLGSTKAYVNKLNIWITVLGLLVTGFLSAVAGYFAGDYVAKLLKNYGFEAENSD